MAIEDLGTPLGNAYAITDGQAQLYERGLTIDGTDGKAEVQFAFPMLARPAVATDSFAHPLHFWPGRWPREKLVAAINEAIRDRLCVVATGQPDVRVVLGAVGTTSGGASLTASGLQNRQLYDIAINAGAGWQVVAPHAVYSRTSWTDFGIAHITDMHVARRIDDFRGILNDARREDAAARMYNWNDRFRGFVRYANYLHSIGVLDVIVATGDNYDYMFEKDDDTAGGGNAAFLRDLILGKAPGPEFSDVEELRVPIFMVPGNHDYRKEPYTLVFDLQIDGTLRAVIGSLPLGNFAVDKDLTRVKNFHGYHLTQEDASLIANHFEGLSGNGIQNIRAEAAGRMVDIDKEIPPYRRCLGEPGSYVVKLGKHRIAMIDSAHDVGIVTEQLAALLVTLGFGNEDQDMFVGGNPNCVGVTPDTLKDVSDAFADPDATGLFIVGLHAPLFNPTRDGYSYFLRETQRAVQGDQVHGFLGRDASTVVPAHINSAPDTPADLGLGTREKKELEAQVEKNHPTWFPESDSGDHRPPSYVKRVSSDDQFACGVSTNAAKELTKLLAGVGSNRAADVVLAGHTHFYNEYRVGKAWNSDELAFYFDFYTQNPTNYYPTKFTRSWVRPGRRPDSAAPDMGYTVDAVNTYIEVSPDAAPDAKPWPMPLDAPDKFILQVPPYANPLNSAADPRAWWEQHRPLVLQTGALGPLRTHEFFSGFRVLAVKNNIIDKIHYVPTARLEQSQYRLDWNQAILPESPRSYHYIERSRPLRSPAAVGAPAAISFPALGATNIVYRDADGRLHELWRKGTDKGNSDLTALASNAMRAASDPTLYIDTVDGLEVALYRGTDNHVYSMYWSTGEVRRDALSGSVDAPRADGKPVGYVGKDGYRHAIYRAQDGHMHELYWTGPNPPGHGDISTAVGAPKAAGDPIAYQKLSNGENVVIYRGRDNHIHGLYWTTGAVRHDDLSGFARAPDAAGDPTAYYSTAGDVHQIVYRSADGHLHELWWQGNNPVSHWDLTAATHNAPMAADDASGDPIAYYSAGNNLKHVIYRSKDGHLNELSWTPGTAKPTHIDLTVWALAPVAADKPASFVVAPNTQSVLFRGTDNQIHEIRWDQASSTTNAFILTEAIQPPAPWHRATMLNLQPQ